MPWVLLHKLTINISVTYLSMLLLKEESNFHWNSIIQTIYSDGTSMLFMCLDQTEMKFYYISGTQNCLIVTIHHMKNSYRPGFKKFDWLIVSL